MRKIRDVLRLKLVAGLSDRAIARSIGVGRTTVQECLQHAAAANLSWPLPEDVDDAQLQARLYPRATEKDIFDANNCHCVTIAQFGQALSLSRPNKYRKIVAASSTPRLFQVIPAPITREGARCSAVDNMHTMG